MIHAPDGTKIACADLVQVGPRPLSSNVEVVLKMQLTEIAAGKVKELLDQEGQPEAYLRVAAMPGGCCGYRYSMALTDQLGDDDTTHEVHGVRLVVDPQSAPLLSEATIDFVDSLERSGFAIDNPKAGGGCNCGH